ncbi:hypothetical protein ONE63_001633 [Megalurothrips usitatus]|uniref:Myb/SANT-like DNA-binding domain-containing protein n=1 Tax=Megalurothrips usitatus TaxID=439358 RepID=A0AAV7XG65_9NEOP|nr:hypothetical protein ONE63_001633 [Megalurothrips usitatus]
MEKNIDYSVYDSNGDVHTVKVTEKEAAALDIDHKRTFRLLNKLKGSAEVNRRWTETATSPVLNSGDNTPWMPPGSTGATLLGPSATSSPVATVVPPVSRAQGKTGAQWNKEQTRTFLHVCGAFRQSLRQRVTPLDAYQRMSDTLFSSHGMDYSALQLREKIRNMKRSFAEAKNGKHLGSDWDFFRQMSFIFDSLMGSVEVDENCASGLEHFGSFQPEAPEAPEANAAKVVSDEENNNISIDFDFHQSVVNNNGVHQANGPTAVSSAEGETDVQVGDLDYYPFLMDDDDDIVNDRDSGHIPEGRVDVDDKLTTRSPAAKQKKNSEGKQQSPRKTPRKTPTPRRKVAGQCHLVWPLSKTNAFLEECVTLKEEVQKENVAVETWKKIAEKLTKREHDVTWQQCRSKFVLMNQFFADSILPVNGILGGVQWPYYQCFLKIHDLPADYEIPVSVASLSASGTLWQDDKTVLLLINIYKERYHLFKGSQSMIRHSSLYLEISTIMQMYEIRASGEQCKSKEKELEMKFRQEYDKKRKTGSAPSSWTFYEPMLEIYGNNASLEAVFAFSVGGSNHYTHKGNVVEAEERQSRSRPPIQPPNHKGAVKKDRKKIYKTEAAGFHLSS